MKKADEIQRKYHEIYCLWLSSEQSPSILNNSEFVMRKIRAEVHLKCTKSGSFRSSYVGAKLLVEVL